MMPLPLGVAYQQGRCDHRHDVSRLQAVLVSADSATWALASPAESPTELALFVGSTPYAAITLAAAQAATLDLVEFFRPFRDEAAATFALYEIELPLLLSLLTMGSNAPSTLVPTTAVDVDVVLGALEREKEDAVLFLEHDGHTVVAFARTGKIVRLYDRATVTQDKAARTRFEELAVTSPDAEIGIYTDIEVRPDPRRREPLRKLLTNDYLPDPVQFTLELSGLTLQFARAQEKITIGRNPASDVVVSHPSVSREHCELRWRGDGYDVADVGSSMGTDINDELLPAFAPHGFYVGDTLRVGQVVVKTTSPRIEATDRQATMLRFGATAGKALSTEAKVTPHLICADKVIPLATGQHRIGSLDEAELPIGTANTVVPVACFVTVNEDGRAKLHGPADGRILLNGKALAANTAPLSSGDVIGVAPHFITYARMERRPPDGR